MLYEEAERMRERERGEDEDKRAGKVGRRRHCDGFPDLVFAQSVMHCEDAAC